MADEVLRKFLARQYDEGMALAGASDILELLPLDGPPPHRYIAEFHAKGLVKAPDGKIAEDNQCHLGIWLPDNYLRCAEAGQILTYLGPSPRPFHPNIRPPVICVHIRPGMSLVELLHTCYELWTWQKFYTGDEGLNHEAAQWARHQRADRFPIDSRPLKRRKLKLTVGRTDRVGQET